MNSPRNTAKAGESESTYNSKTSIYSITNCSNRQCLEASRHDTVSNTVTDVAHACGLLTRPRQEIGRRDESSFRNAVEGDRPNPDLSDLPDVRSRGLTVSPSHPLRWLR